MKNTMSDKIAMPTIVGRVSFQTELDALRVREKAHTHEGEPPVVGSL